MDKVRKSTTVRYSLSFDTAERQAEEDKMTQDETKTAPPEEEPNDGSRYTPEEMAAIVAEKRRHAEALQKAREEARKKRARRWAREDQRAEYKRGRPDMLWIAQPDGPETTLLKDLGYTMKPRKGEDSK